MVKIVVINQKGGETKWGQTFLKNPRTLSLRGQAETWGNGCFAEKNCSRRLRITNFIMQAAVLLNRIWALVVEEEGEQ